MVHKDLFAAKSSFATTNLIESQSDAGGSQVYLKEDDPNAVSLMIEFVYRGTVQRWANKAPVTQKITQKIQSFNFPLIPSRKNPLEFMQPKFKTIGTRFPMVLRILCSKQSYYRHLAHRTNVNNISIFASRRRTRTTRQRRFVYLIMRMATRTSNRHLLSG